MRYAKWIVLALVVGIFAAFLHYTLPQRDIVRITGTDIQRINVGWNGIFYATRMRNAQGDLIGTDVLLIRAITPNGKTRVYRNEDTGFWPPYFKFDSADLQTEAEDLVSTADAPRWAIVRHYGWRNRLITIYPNATSIRPVSSPDVTLIPWFNIIFLTLLAAFLFWLWRRLVAFRERRIDPVIDEIEDASDVARSRVSRFWHRLTKRSR